MATMIRTIRLEIAVDPIAYAAEHGCAVHEALDHLDRRVEAAAIQRAEALGAKAERATLFGGALR